MSIYEHLFSHTARNLRRSEIRELLKLTRKPGIISFAGGLPAPDLFPIDDIREFTRLVLEREGKTALQYGPTEGDTRLRAQLLRLMENDGVHLGIEQLLVVTSSQQGLDLVGKILIDPGDVVIMGRPTYVGAIQAFHSYGADLRGIDLDEQGTRTDLLDGEIAKLIKQGRRPKLIYEVPDFQNPSGITMSAARRRELLEIAEKYDLLVVEDSPYRALRFAGETEPSLLHLAPQRVIGLYTFSKILLPGFRLGWLAGPAELVQKCITAKQAVDLCSPPFNQAVLYEFLHAGKLEPQIARICTAYREKCDYMLQMLERFMPKLPGLRWTRPQGGLFLWVTLPEEMDSAEMFLAAVEKKVAYVVGAAFYPDGGGKNSFRLNFSYSSKEEIESGIQRLAEVIGEWRDGDSFITTP